MERQFFARPRIVRPLRRFPLCATVHFLFVLPDRFRNIDEKIARLGDDDLNKPAEPVNFASLVVDLA